MLEVQVIFPNQFNILFSYTFTYEAERCFPQTYLDENFIDWSLGNIIQTYVPVFFLRMSRIT